jgi:uncharacterized protein YvpB
MQRDGERTRPRRRHRLAAAGAVAAALLLAWPGTAAARRSPPAHSRAHAVRHAGPAGIDSPLRRLRRGHGGAVLDGLGGIHPFGGLSLDTTGAPSWPHRDIARALVLRTDGSGGWVLDGEGAIHAFGAAAPVAAPARWPGRDLARAMAVVSLDADGQPDGRQGYVLDGVGGLHPWGGAPWLDTGVSWPGWDIARGLAVHTDRLGRPDGGWILDGYGGVHAFGAADPLPAPIDRPGRDLYRQLHLAGDVPYAVQRWGVAQGLGSSLDASWDGYVDWGAWDITRDVVVLDANRSHDSPQPVSAAAAHALRVHADRSTIAVPTYRQTRPLDCEAAALQVALAAVGVRVSQDWISATIGADPRPPVLGGGGAVVQWGDPYTTFVGDIDGSEPRHTGYGVYDGPIAAAARAAGVRAVGREGWDPWTIYDEVALGHPAVIWTDTTFTRVPMRQWTAWDGRAVPYAIGEHAVTVVGVDALAGTVTVADVLAGIRRTFPMSRFESFFSSFGNMAVVVG